MSGAAGFCVNGRFLGQRVTGVQRYARGVAAALDRHLSAAGRSAPLLAPAGTPDPGRPALPLRAGTMPLRGHAWEQAALPALAHGPLLNLCNTAPALLKRQVVCIHDANVHVAPEAYGQSFRLLYGALQPLLARRVGRIATVSAFSAGEIARHLPIEARSIAVLPNGHEHALAWAPERAEAAPRLLAGLPGGAARPFVLAIGSRARHKNLGLLLDIAPALDALGVSVVVAGGGAAIFEAAGLEGERANVHLAGYVTDDDLACLMDRALCLAFPSLTEGFGLPIVEAMARGCPVVSSDRASMPEVCGNAAIMAAPDDPAAWVAAIRRLAGSADLRAELADLGRARVRRFSWAATAAGYVDLLEGLAR